MKPRRIRSVLVLATGVLVLTACTASPPPAAELADEMVDTLDVSDAVKACMKEEVAGFELTEEEAEGFSDLDDVASKAADGQALALQIIQRFEDTLAGCIAAG